MAEGQGHGQDQDHETVVTERGMININHLKGEHFIKKFLICSVHSLPSPKC